MSLATHRTALVALLNGVANIGRVHAYQRYARAEADFAALYLHTLPDGAKQLRGWQVSNVEIEEKTLGVGRVVVRYGWRMRGYMALADAQATELAFDSLVEDVRAAYRADPTLGGAAEVDDELDGIQKLDAGPVLFCGVLCHSALLGVKTKEYL